jgi:hypothetical protein
MFGSFSKIAGGNVSPARFVKLHTEAGQVVHAGAGDRPWGISQPHTRRLALADWDDGYAAIDGENLNVIGPGDDEALLELGGTVTHGMLLKASTDGVGIEADTDKDKAGAIALQDGADGDLIKVKPILVDVAV